VKEILLMPDGTPENFLSKESISEFFHHFVSGNSEYVWVYLLLPER